MSLRATIVRTSAALALITSAGLLIAGPVAPTYKTLAEVEPRIPISFAGASITQPGSYYLTRDLVTASGNAISINASGVTLDLSGFSLIGQPGASKGIVIIGTHSDITIRNGAITNWPVRGIEGSGNSNCRYVDLTFAECGFDGLMAGSNSLISNCVSRDNGEDGFHAGTYSAVTHCTASGNGAAGFRLDGNAVISGCTSTGNAQNGIAAFAGSRLSDCVVSSNGLSGITATARCLITGNNCAGNGVSGTGAGIALLARTTASTETTSPSTTSACRPRVRATSFSATPPAGTPAATTASRPETRSWPCRPQ